MVAQRTPTGSASDGEHAPEVFAAGGIVWAPDGDERVVVLVHRPHYDDWTFPKGKRDPGESDEDCARREVWEETGLRVELGPELPVARYVDHRGRRKQVRYWAMTTPTDLHSFVFEPNDEVDRIAVLEQSEAAAVLTHALDVEVLEAFVAIEAGRNGSGRQPN